MGLPDSSAGKEPACSAGDPSWIRVSGKATRLQYPWTSLVVQLVKNPSVNV